MTSDPGLRRLDQGMAVAASRALPAVVDPDTLTRLRQLPVLLHTAGLAATLAFLDAKSGQGTPLEQAYQNTAAAITDRVAARLGIEPAPTPHAMLATLGGLGAVDYQLASSEAQAFAGWLRRIAEGRATPSRPGSERAERGGGSAGPGAAG
jgi:CRISPR/Cas system CMR-associated protein Cmr5 small subunit